MDRERPRRRRVINTADVVPLSVMVPTDLRRRVRREAIAEGMTLQEWITAAVVEELARRRTLGV